VTPNARQIPQKPSHQEEERPPSWREMHNSLHEEISQRRSMLIVWSTVARCSVELQRFGQIVQETHPPLRQRPLQ